MSDAEIKRYFSELTGQALPARPTRLLPNGDVIYTVSTRYGNFNLRSLSSSVLTSTGKEPRWTIDIPSSISGTRKSKWEIKFE